MLFVRGPRLLLALLAAAAMASPLAAQAPYEHWRTVDTPHFRVHYPREYEAWAMRVATRLEPIRSAVVQEVGFEPAQRTDVLIVNPEAQANGLTLPLLDTPRIVLYAETPDPESQIGEFGDWTDLLVTHEMTHLIHLLRPSRNRMQRALEQLLLPLSPITTGAPRWVLEGYATVVEGRLTGSGRPPGTQRAAILREWAQNGRLPSYAQLASDRRFMGMSMAYLAGSAFLEWLEERSGPGSLQHLWARMTARQRRDFSSAFQGVFGDKPERLYGRFTAELTERAVNVNRETAGDLREGTLWQETTRGSGDPVVSPDGRQIAVVERGEHGPAKLVIWSTAPATEEEQKFEKRISRILARDPQDVAPVPGKPLSRKPVHSLKMIDGGDIEGPRWMRDGQSILFTHRQPDRSADLHRDLFRWTPSSGHVERVTHLADVFDADPMPDGTTAVAVRSRFGFSQLVNVNLATGGVKDLTAPSLDRIDSHPRVSSDGTRIAFAAHEKTVWRLIVRNIATGDETVIATPERSNVSSPEWSRTSDDIFATLLSGGFADIHRFTIGGGDAAITRVTGAAFSPAPSPDGRLFFMSLEPDGFVVRLRDRPEPAPPRTLIARSLVPALPPEAATPAVFGPSPVGPAHGYGFGRQELAFLVNGTSAPSAYSTEIGLRTGDVAGRLEALAVASLSGIGSPRGGTIGAAWRGWPVTAIAQLFRVDEPLAKRSGADLRGEWRSRFPIITTVVEAGASQARIRDESQASRSRDLIWSEASANAALEKIRGEIDLSAGGGSMQFAHAGARGGVKLAGLWLEAQVRRDETRNVKHLTDEILVGGIATTIMPQSMLITRVLEPALPTAVLGGRRYTGEGLSLRSGVMTLFYRRHEIGDVFGPALTPGSDQTIRIAGLEMAASAPPTPIIKLPALDLTVGVARPLDGPTRHRTQWWIGIRYEP